MSPCTSVPEVSSLLRVKQQTVLNWIRSGRLLGVNVASEGARRPRWRIRESNLEAFLLSRTGRAPAKPQRKRRMEADFVRYFS